MPEENVSSSFENSGKSSSLEIIVSRDNYVLRDFFIIFTPMGVFSALKIGYYESMLGIRNSSSSSTSQVRKISRAATTSYMDNIQVSH